MTNDQIERTKTILKWLECEKGIDGYFDLECIGFGTFSLEKMQFHLSYDWIMRVVDKIVNVKHKTYAKVICLCDHLYISNDNYVEMRILGSDLLIHYINNHGDNLVMNIFKTCSDFCEYYNDNNK